MAKQAGILKIEGTLDQLTFYKSVDGHLVRTKGGVSGERIATDPVFARTRENGQEFASAAKSGKLLRDSIRTKMLSAADNRVTSRLTKVMTEIKNHDSTSARGERNVGVGIATPAGLNLLNGFNFNENAILSSILFAAGDIDFVTGVASIPSLTPINDIAYPSGATHVSISGAYAVIDFANDANEVYDTNVVNLPINGTTSIVSLTPSSIPSIPGTKIYFLLIEFFQEVNAVQYTLKNGAYNALAVVKVG